MSSICALIWGPPDSLLQSLQHFLSPQVPPKCTVMQLTKYSFVKTTLRLVVQAPQNQAAPGTRSGVLLPMQLEVCIHHYSRQIQSRGQACGGNHSATVTNATPEAANQAQGLQCANWLSASGDNRPLYLGWYLEDLFICGEEFHPTNLVGW